MTAVMGSLGPTGTLATMTQLATLQCTARQPSTGQRCPRPARTGTRRCGHHPGDTPERLRCRYRWPDGVRCEGRTPADKIGSVDLCHCHHLDCPGFDGTGCERKIGSTTRPLCRTCAPKARTRPGCGLRVDEDQFCQRPATRPDSQCGHHRLDRLPPQATRCQHAYTDGEQCHRGRFEGTVCRKHLRPCARDGCPHKVGSYVAGALCRLDLPRCREAGCGAAVGAKGGWCPTHHPDRKDCPEWSAQAGRPCEAPPLAIVGRCSKHRNLPADADRCTYEFVPGKRCPRRREDRQAERCGAHRQSTGRPVGRPVGPNGPSHRPCTVCGRTTRSKSGLCRDHSVRCTALAVLTSTQCTRSATSWEPVPRCQTHADSLSVEEAIAAAASAAVPSPPRPGCPLTTGPGSLGHSCGGLAQDNGRCHSHQSLPAGRDRCQHLYSNGARCPVTARGAQGHGHGQVCADHLVECVHPGCADPTSNLEVRLCGQHAPRCTGTASHTDRSCTVPAIRGTDRCYDHTSGFKEGLDRRCAHLFDSGDRCVNMLAPARVGNHLWRQLCGFHAVKCTGSGCPHRSAFTDGLCKRCRPRCRVCALPAVVGETCWWHWAVAEFGQCALRTQDGELCRYPAAVDSPDDGRICSAHAASLPEPDRRCRHVSGTGERCAASQDHAVAWCQVHQPLYTAPCEWLTVRGVVCGKPTTPRDDELKPTCEQHRKIPADHDRCCVEVGDAGQRCPAARLARRDVCGTHCPRQARCAAVDSQGVRCWQRAPRGFSTCDRHAAWVPGASEDPAESYLRFFLRPRWELVRNLVAEVPDSRRTGGP